MKGRSGWEYIKQWAYVSEHISVSQDDINSILHDYGLTDRFDLTINDNVTYSPQNQNFEIDMSEGLA